MSPELKPEQGGAALPVTQAILADALAKVRDAFAGLQGRQKRLEERLAALEARPAAPAAPAPQQGAWGGGQPRQGGGGSWGGGQSRGGGGGYGGRSQGGGWQNRGGGGGQGQQNPPPYDGQLPIIPYEAFDPGVLQENLGFGKKFPNATWAWASTDGQGRHYLEFLVRVKCAKDGLDPSRWGQDPRMQIALWALQHGPAVLQNGGGHQGGYGSPDPDPDNGRAIDDGVPF